MFTPKFIPQSSIKNSTFTSKTTHSILFLISNLVQISSDGKTFETIASGEWAADTNWKIVTFDAVQTKYVRLVSKDAVSGETGKAFASAAEIRLTGTEAEVEVCQHTETTVVGKMDATCTAEGYTGDTVCAECGHVVTKGTAVAKSEHTEVTVAGTAATCTETGLTEGKKCSVCNAVTVAQEVIPAKGHDLTEVAAKEPTTTAAGNKEHYVCETCDKLFLDEAGKNATTKEEVTYALSVMKEVIPMLQKYTRR